MTKDTKNTTKTNVKLGLIGKIKKYLVLTLIFIVILAFVPFILSDYIFNMGNGNINDTKWVTVGDKFATDSMVLGDYQQAVKENAQIVSQNPELLNNIFNDVLQRLSSTLVYSTEAERLGITISKAEIYKIIRSLPQLQDEQGNLDAAAFNAVVSQYFGNEEVFLSAIRNSVLQDMLVSSFAPLIVQHNYVSYLDFLAISQQRSISYITLDKSNIKLTNKPTPEQLTAIRDENKEFFNTSEKRSGEVLIISKKVIAKEITPTSEELNEYYDNNIGKFIKSEKRKVLQALFPNEKEATSFYNSLIKLNFDEILTNTSLVNLGEIDRVSSFTEKSIINAVFSAGEKSVIKPVQSSIGWHVFVIDGLIAAKPMLFSEAKASVYNDVFAVKLQKYENGIKDQLQALGNNSKAFANLAKPLNGEIVTFSSITDNSPNMNVKLNAEIKKTIFNLNSVRLSDPLEDTQGSMYVVNLSNIDDSRLVTIDEAKKELTALWTDNETSKELNLLKNNLITDIAAGKNINSLGFKILSANLSRVNNNSIFNKEAVDEIFKRNISISNTTPVVSSAAGNKVFIVVIDKVTNSNEAYIVNKKINPKVAQFNLATDNLTINSILESMNAELNKKFKVVVNEKAIQARFNEVNQPQAPNSNSRHNNHNHR